MESTEGFLNCRVAEIQWEWRVPLEDFIDWARGQFRMMPGREFVNHVCDRLSNDFFN